MAIHCGMEFSVTTGDSWVIINWVATVVGTLQQNNCILDFSGGLILYCQRFIIFFSFQLLLIGLCIGSVVDVYPFLVIFCVSPSSLSLHGAREHLHNLLNQYDVVLVSNEVVFMIPYLLYLQRHVRMIFSCHNLDGLQQRTYGLISNFQDSSYLFCSHIF